MKAPSEEIYTANQRKEHNIESTLYIHWVTTLSLTIRVFIRLADVASQHREITRNSDKI